MKRLAFAAIILSLSTPLFAEEKPPQLKDLKDKASYAFGLYTGLNMHRQNIDINQDIFVAGLKDALSQRKPLLTEKEVKETLMAFQKEVQEKAMEQAKKNDDDGQKFLAENKKKDGVKTTASGLQYKVLKEGSGAQPKPTDIVTVNYRGTLIDGTEFDSSYKSGQPATFPVTGVIKGFTEALQLMKVGSKYQLFIPSSLAYGEHPSGPEIPAGSTLIFEVELMNVKSQPPAGAITAPTPLPSPK